MTDTIDWQSQPEATHYADESCRVRGFLRKDPDEWLIMYEETSTWIGMVTDYSGEDELTPRPAQYRNWEDPAMWFDAPEWAVAVINGSGDFEGCLYYVSGRAEVGDEIIEIGVSNRSWIIESGEGIGEVIATRPTPEEPTLNDMLEGVKPDMFTESNDNVNHPNHYTQGGIECIDALEAALTSEEFRGYCKGNAMKYCWRMGLKDDKIQDAKKAIWYLNRICNSE